MHYTISVVTFICTVRLKGLRDQLEDTQFTVPEFEVKLRSKSKDYELPHLLHKSEQGTEGLVCHYLVTTK